MVYKEYDLIFSNKQCMLKLKTKYILSSVFGLIVMVCVGFSINIFTSSNEFNRWFIRTWIICFILSIAVWCYNTPEEELYESHMHRVSDSLKQDREIEYQRKEIELLMIKEEKEKKREFKNRN